MQARRMRPTLPGGRRPVASPPSAVPPGMNRPPRAGRSAVSRRSRPVVSGANSTPTSPLTASIPKRITDRVRKPASWITGSSRIQPPSAIRTTPNMNPCAVLRRSVGNSSPLQSWNSDCWPMPAPAPKSTTLISAVVNVTSKKMKGTNAASCRIELAISILRRLTRSISGM